MRRVRRGEEGEDRGRGRRGATRGDEERGRRDRHAAGGHVVGENRSRRARRRAMRRVLCVVGIGGGSKNKNKNKNKSKLISTERVIICIEASAPSSPRALSRTRRTCSRGGAAGAGVSSAAASVSARQGPRRRRRRACASSCAGSCSCSLLVVGLREGKNDERRCCGLPLPLPRASEKRLTRERRR